MIYKEKISPLIDQLIEKCDSWITLNDKGNLSLIDPIDHKEIGEHYGTSHLGCAFIIIGKDRNNSELVQKGKQLILNVLENWESNIQSSNFHFDFNNFALAVTYNYLEIDNEDICERIKQTIISSEDSGHNTINWLPMRAYVNIRRYEWTKNKKYKLKSDHLLKLIKKATNIDGGIEDQLPKGISYNIQYNISSVAALQFINLNNKKVDLYKEISFLTDKILPDGDINYTGRGVNQIFAWGPWLYILSTINNLDQLELALKFLNDRVSVMLSKNNLMLNNWEGNEKYLWWDYHHTSVYIPHFLFWLSLSQIDYNKTKFITENIKSNDTGLKLIKHKEYYLSSFNGRCEYFSEFGPSINALWLKKYGIIFKGGGGPFNGNFGKKHSFKDIVVRNHFGLIEMSNSNKTIKLRLNRFINKTISNKTTPIFCNYNITNNSNEIIIEFENHNAKKVILNIPSILSKNKFDHISLVVDGSKISLYENMKIRNQYNWVNIIQSNISNGKIWKLKIK